MGLHSAIVFAHLIKPRNLFAVKYSFSNSWLVVGPHLGAALMVNSMLAQLIL